MVFVLRREVWHERLLNPTDEEVEAREAQFAELVKVMPVAGGQGRLQAGAEWLANNLLGKNRVTNKPPSSPNSIR
jgi:hypothetical protein